MESSNSTPAPQEGELASSRYSSLESFRQPYLSRGYDCAEVTIPSLLPRNGISSGTALVIPWQNMGSRGVNNLSSKLLLALFPANTPFFRYMVDEQAIKDGQAAMPQGDQESYKAQIMKALGEQERAIMTDVEKSGDRVPLHEALKHIVVTGNALLWNSKDGFRVYHLSHYVVRRDPSGNVLEIITKEQVDRLVLPKAVVEQIERAEQSSEKKPTEKTLDLYTRVERTQDGWKAHQEVCGIKILTSISTYPIDKCPWIPLRFTRIDGEDYGRGYVEEHLGDLRSLEALRQALVEGTAAGAKVLFLVKPNSSTSARVLSEAPNGAVRSGDANDVTVLHLDKQNDFQVAMNLQTEIKGDLAYSFLMNSAVQRNAERVTAEEVRYVAQELEATLGGFYSIMAVELQLPYVKLKIASMLRRGKLKKLPKDLVSPTIVTGVEALGRGNDRTKLLSLMTDLTQALGPEIVQERVNITELISRIATSDGIDTEGLIYDQATVQQNQLAAQQRAMADKLGPNAITAGGKLMQEGMKQNAQGTSAAGSPGPAATPAA